MMPLLKKVILLKVCVRRVCTPGPFHVQLSFRSSVSRLSQANVVCAVRIMSSWFSRWHLSVNPAKTNCMVLRSTGMPACQLNIKINGNHITQVTRHRHLGVTFNERLSWKNHLHDVINKSSKKMDSSVALAGNCLHPLSGISMRSASGLVSNMAALSGVASVPQCSKL